MSDIEIIKKGTWPILLYVVRKPKCWRASVFIDDEVGAIVGQVRLSDLDEEGSFILLTLLALVWTVVATNLTVSW